MMRTLLALVAALTVLAIPASLPASDARGFVVIVSVENPIGAVDRAFLADAFLKKTTAWPNGGVIHPVDLPPSSRVRREFTQDVLHKTISEVKGYWQQRIFSGRDVPPPELDTESEVVEYVRRHDGAVGYVSATTSAPGVKPLGVQ